MRYIPFIHLSNAIEKRCRNGYHMNPKTGQCEPKNQKGTTNTSQGCQEGFHQHGGYKNCHEIWKPHKSHTMSCNEHRRMGIPCRYKGEILDKNGRPIIAGLPTRKWNSMSAEEREALERANREKENRKEEKEKEPKKEKETKTEEIKGLPKHPMVNKTRNMMMETFDSFKELKEIGDNVVNVLESFNPEKDKIRKVYKTALEKLPWCDRVNFNKQITDDDLIKILPDMTKAIKENPIGLIALTGFVTNFKGSSVMSYTSWAPKKKETGNIEINKGFLHSPDKKVRYVKKTCPVSNKVTDWSFLVVDTDNYDSFSHEWGHTMLSVLCMLKYQASSPHFESSESKENRKKAVEELIVDPMKSIRKYLGKDDDYSVDYTIRWKNGRPTIVVEEYINRHSSEYANLISEIESQGFKVGWSSTAIALWFAPSDSMLKELPAPSGFKKHISNDMNILRDLVDTNNLDMRFGSNTLVEDVFPYKTELIRECEEIYKKLYDVDEIIPSDVYTGYGYLATNNQLYWGTNTDDNAKVPNVPLNWRRADERVAEAFSDIVFRGERANSMSNVIVSAVQYYISAILNENPESFKDYTLRTYDKNNIGECVKKQRYIKLKMYHV